MIDSLWKQLFSVLRTLGIKLMLVDWDDLFSISQSYLENKLKQIKTGSLQLTLLSASNGIFGFEESHR